MQNYMKYKKAQLKIQQMSFMLIAVVLFFVLAGMFFLIFKTSGIKEDVELMRRDKAILNTLYIAGSAELTCGENCIDTDKIMALKNFSVYDKLWSFSIEIQKVYPESTEKIECNYGNYPNCNFFNINSKGEENKVSSFVSLCRREPDKKCELGRIIIGYESE